jgi:hypothetical protein
LDTGIESFVYAEKSAFHPQPQAKLTFGVLISASSIRVSAVCCGVAEVQYLLGLIERLAVRAYNSHMSPPFSSYTFIGIAQIV